MYKYVRLTYVYEYLCRTRSVVTTVHTSLSRVSTDNESCITQTSNKRNAEVDLECGESYKEITPQNQGADSSVFLEILFTVR